MKIKWIEQTRRWAVLDKDNLVLSLHKTREGAREYVREKNAGINNPLHPFKKDKLKGEPL